MVKRWARQSPEKETIIQWQSLQGICPYVGAMWQGNAEQTSQPVRLWRWNI